MENWLKVESEFFERASESTMKFGENLIESKETISSKVSVFKSSRILWMNFRQLMIFYCSLTLFFNACLEVWGNLLPDKKLKDQL
jgi:hypothetical protein